MEDKDPQEHGDVWVTKWVTTWGDRVVRYARFLTGDAALAQDVAQETFLRLYLFHRRHPDRIVTPPWVFTVARRVSTDLMRRRGPVRSVPDIERAAPGSLEMPLAAMTVHDVLGRLPWDDRVCLYLFYYVGLTSQEIGEHLGIPAATVRARLHRARQRFKGQWEEDSNDRG